MNNLQSIPNGTTEAMQNFLAFLHDLPEVNACVTGLNKIKEIVIYSSDIPLDVPEKKALLELKIITDKLTSLLT